MTWLDNYTHLNSAHADAAAGGAPRRQPEEGELPPDDAVDVGLSQLPPAAVLGAREDRELTSTHLHTLHTLGLAFLQECQQ